MKGWLALSIVSALVLGYPVPAASGGGATFDFGSDYVVIGQTVTGRTEVWLGAKRSGELADGPYHAYLVPSDTRFSQEGLPPDAVWLAPVSFKLLPGPYASATVSFEVPAVAPGEYSLVVCNVPCTTRTVGDLVGGWFSIAASPTEARIQALADRLDWKTRALGREAKREERRATNAEDALRSTVAELQGELDALRDASRARPQAPEASGLGWAWAGWAAAVLLALAGLVRRRKRAAPLPGPEAEWIIPEERVPART
jgi:hypothetical protein